MLRGTVFTYLHSDHLGSTVMETNNLGAMTADQKYFAYGKQRDTGTVVTDHRFTGQKSDGSGLTYMNARYYDPSIGTFVSPDTIVPDAGNVFDYDRFMYVHGNAMNAIDPSGHFTETELEKWYGKNWRDILQGPLRDYLLLAQYGDVLIYGTSAKGTPLMAMFVDNGGTLAGWSISSDHQGSIVDVLDFTRNPSNNMGLYRSSAQFSGEIGGAQRQLEARPVDYQNAAYNGSNVFRRVGDSSMSDTLALPLDWYIGSTQHVENSYRGKGFKPGFSDGATLGVITFTLIKGIVSQGIKKALTSTLGGPVAAGGLVVNIAEMFKVDPYYYTVPNSMTQPMMPVPPSESRDPQ